MEVDKLAKIVRVRYENGVFKPLDRIEGLRDGEVVVVKVLDRDIAEEVFGSIKVDRERVEKALKEAEDEFALY